jgi:hypothetical protein
MSGKEGKKDDDPNVIKKKFEPHLEYGNYLQVASFLGGITIAAMIVLMQSQQSFNFEPWSSTVVYYPEILIGVLGGAATIFLVSLVGILDVSMGYAKPAERHIDFCERLLWVGYVVLIGIIPFLILPFSVIGAIIIGIIAISLWITMYILSKLK